MTHTAHLALDVGSRLAQGGAVVHGAIEGFFDGIERARLDEVDAVQALVAELGRARRRAAAAEAEAVQGRREIAALRQERDVLAGEARLAVARADRAEGIAHRVIEAVQRDRAARAA